MSRLSARLHRWLDYVAPLDPDWSTPGSLDQLDATYPTRDEVRAAIVRGTSSMRAGTTLLKPQDVDRATREVMALLRREATEPVDADQPTGEIGHFPTGEIGHFPTGGVR